VGQFTGMRARGVSQILPAGPQSPFVAHHARNVLELITVWRAPICGFRKEFKKLCSWSLSLPLRPALSLRDSTSRRELQSIHAVVPDLTQQVGLRPERVLWSPLRIDLYWFASSIRDCSLLPA